MVEHAHRHEQQDHPHGASSQADLLDSDAEVFGTLLEDVAGWVQELLDRDPRRIVDVGAGTGTAGTFVLAPRFPTAELVAVDSSGPMLDRLRLGARDRGLLDRVRCVHADLDLGWPAVGVIDLAWAGSSLHHLADPGRVLADLYGALRPGGLLAVLEMDALPRFLPQAIDVPPGLEARLQTLVASSGWNQHPDWRPPLERAGFAVTARTFTFAAQTTAPPGAGRCAQAYLSRIGSALGDQLTDGHRAALDRLLTDDHPGALLRRDDLDVRGSRTVWLARRP